MLCGEFMSWVILIKNLLVCEHRASNFEESVSDAAQCPCVAMALGTLWSDNQDYSEFGIILIVALYITPFLSQGQAPPVSFVQFRMTDQAQRTVSIIIYPIIREILLTTIRFNLKTECCFYLKNNIRKEQSGLAGWRIGS